MNIHISQYLYRQPVEIIGQSAKGLKLGQSALKISECKDNRHSSDCTKKKTDKS